VEVKIKDKILECIKGDITEQEGFSAIVNAANAELRPGGGVSGAIHRKAGSYLYEECKKLAPIRVGEAVITKGYNLPNPYVIHTLGPIYSQEKDPAKKLSLCFRNCLRLAEERRLTSIAFCAISTGIFGYPLKEAAEVSLKTVIDELSKLKYIKRVRFVLYDDKTLAVFEDALKKIIKGIRK